MSQFWEPTHFSVDDGSPARLVEEGQRGLALFENENGDRWHDPINLWEADDE